MGGRRGKFTQPESWESCKMNHTLSDRSWHFYMSSYQRTTLSFMTKLDSWIRIIKTNSNNVCQTLSSNLRLPKRNRCTSPSWMDIRSGSRPLVRMREFRYYQVALLGRALEEGLTGTAISQNATFSFEFSGESAQKDHLRGTVRTTSGILKLIKKKIRIFSPYWES